METRAPIAIQQFYVAVGCVQSKLLSLVDLLSVLASQSGETLAVGVCCSGRDSLDEAVVALAQVPGCQLACLHADMSVVEVGLTVQAFRHAADVGEERDGQGQWQAEDIFTHPDELRERALFQALQHREGDNGHGDVKARVLVVTDAALKNVPEAIRPVGARLIINLDLPASREFHHRRLGTLIGAPGTLAQKSAVIHFVVAGQIADFRALEKFTHAAIYEMPVHVSDVFAS